MAATNVNVNLASISWMETIYEPNVRTSMNVNCPSIRAERIQFARMLKAISNVCARMALSVMLHSAVNVCNNRFESNVYD